MNNTFLSCDWGTSSFRLRLVDAITLQVKGESFSDEGVTKIFEQWQQQGVQMDRLIFYQSVLHRHRSKLEADLDCSLNDVPIVITGMASSTIGMKELPYKHLPFYAVESDLHYEVINSTGQFSNEVLLISGARTDRDVMRGEETQLAGCVDAAKEQLQMFIFPGTHSKHVSVEKGYATHFKTYMTGEFFHLLSVNSILSKSVSAGGSIEVAQNEAAFTAGVMDSRHNNLLHHSFMVRTNDLFQRFSKEQNFWYLSGLVIGTELNALLEKHVGEITIVSQGSIAGSYKMAFKALGSADVDVVDVNRALIKAHAMIFRKVFMG